MAILEIRTCPEPVLRKQTGEVLRIDKSVFKLVDDMFETMYDAPGIGLAASQVGVSKRIFTIDISRKNEPIVLINPKIISKQGEDIDEEGCLSIPGINGDVKRATEVEVSGFNIDGKEVIIKAEGLLARAIQHEVDHLNGCLFWDRIEGAARDILKRKYKKMCKE